MLLHHSVKNLSLFGKVGRRGGRAASLSSSFCMRSLSGCPVQHHHHNLPPVDLNDTSPSKPSEPPKPYSEIPGPKIYPLAGSIIDLKGKMDKGMTMFAVFEEYRKLYGHIIRQNISGEEVMIFDPREIVKGNNNTSTHS